MKIALVVNFEKLRSADIAERILRDYGDKVQFICDSFTQGKLAFKNILLSDTIFSECDLCIVIGGDGTILHNAKKAALHGKPVLGINSGRIGYLAGLKEAELDHLSKLFDGSYFIEERMMIDVHHITENDEIVYNAFNDAVISKGSLSRMIDIELSARNHSINYRSDGLIIATPTGSTAYSMSAGGPVVDPTTENIIITPICPYSDFTRSLVLPSENEVSVSVDLKDGKEAFMSIDGEIAVSIKNGELVKINRSETKVKLINLNLYNSLERITGGISHEK